jgi:DNA-binding Lrp family transcriptional regulator
MRKGDSALNDKDAKRIRALKMLEYKINNGASNLEVADRFGLSVATVGRELSWARRAKLLVNYEDKILEELIPAAHSALKLALTDTDNPQEAAKVAIEIFKGTMPGFKKSKVAAGTAGESELATYIAQLRGEAGRNDAIVDGEVENNPLLALPAAAQSTATQGNDGSSGGNPTGDSPGASDAPALGLGVEQGTHQGAE